MKKYSINPVPKPRMTQSDKWKKRKCVQEYYAYKDEIRLNNVSINNGNTITFIIPFPKSYNKKKQEKLVGQPHTIKPDIDNLLKGILDAIYDSDSHIWDIHTKKVWGEEGGIIIS